MIYTLDTNVVVDALRRPAELDYLKEFLLTRVVTENTLRRGFAPGEDDKVTG